MEMCRGTAEVQIIPRPSGVMSRKDPPAQTWSHPKDIRVTLGHTRLVPLLLRDSVEQEEEAMGVLQEDLDLALVLIDHRTMVDLMQIWEMEVVVKHPVPVEDCTQVDRDSFHQLLEVLDLQLELLLEYWQAVNTVEVRGLLVRIMGGLVDKEAMDLVEDLPLLQDTGHPFKEEMEDLAKMVTKEILGDRLEA